jgi:cell division protein ZapA
MQEPVQIEVLGQKFTLKGNYDNEYVDRVEKYINDKIQEVQKQTAAINTHNLLILVALNLADECFKKEEELAEVRKKIEGTAERLIDIIDTTISSYSGV